MMILETIGLICLQTAYAQTKEQCYTEKVWSLYTINPGTVKCEDLSAAANGCTAYPTDFSKCLEQQKLNKCELSFNRDTEKCA